MTDATSRKTPNILIRALNVLVSGGIFAMTGVLILQVFCRYALGASLSWSEELSRYIMIWAAMLGAVALLSDADFVSFRWLVNLLGQRANRVVSVFMTLVSISFLALVTYVGGGLALYDMAQLSPALYLPIGWVYAALPVGALLMALRLVWRLFHMTEAKKHHHSI